MAIISIMMLLFVITVLIGVLVALVIAQRSGASGKRKRQEKRKRAPHMARPVRSAPAGDAGEDEDEWIEYMLLEDDLDADGVSDSDAE